MAVGTAAEEERLGVVEEDNRLLGRGKAVVVGVGSIEHDRSGRETMRREEVRNVVELQNDEYCTR